MGGGGSSFSQADCIEHCFSLGTSIENAMMLLKTLTVQLFHVAQFISCFKEKECITVTMANLYKFHLHSHLKNFLPLNEDFVVIVAAAGSLFNDFLRLIP